jgi:hypothetical protein
MTKATTSNPIDRRRPTMPTKTTQRMTVTIDFSDDLTVVDLLKVVSDAIQPLGERAFVKAVTGPRVHAEELEAEARAEAGG